MITILGSNGQIGQDLVNTLKDSRGYSGNHIRVGYPFWSELREKDTNKFIVNTVAKHKTLESCEERYTINELTETNLNFLRSLIEHCLETNKILINFSTNFVYSDNSCYEKPYKEFSPRGPKGMYAMSKCWGEYMLEHYTKTRGLRFYNLRVAAVHGTKGNNFIETVYRILNEKGSIDLPINQETSFTTTDMIIKAIKHLVQGWPFGHYNVAANGGGSWYSIAQHAMRGRGFNVEKCIFGKVVDDPIRPEYSIMDIEKIGTGNMPRLWKAIDDYNEKVKDILWQK